VENNKKMLSKLIDRDEAEAVLESFHSEGVKRIDQNSQRKQRYTKKINSGDRYEAAKVANTLLRKKKEVEADGKKFYKNDEEMLKSIKNILFKEIALALDLTEAAVQRKINKIIAESN